VHVKSRTEIGELAETFNVMSRSSSISCSTSNAPPTRTEIYLWLHSNAGRRGRRKNPYTRGHSDRVTRYSIMMLKKWRVRDFIETVRISANCMTSARLESRTDPEETGRTHPEEFDIMKTHTTKAPTFCARWRIERHDSGNRTTP